MFGFFCGFGLWCWCFGFCCCFCSFVCLFGLFVFFPHQKKKIPKPKQQKHKNTLTVLNKLLHTLMFMTLFGFSLHMRFF